MNQKEITLHEALLQIKQSVEHVESGICQNLLNIMGSGCFVQQSDWFDHIIKMWPKYSGNSMFPVPSGDESIPPDCAYVYCQNVWEGKYGELRKELLDFLIEKTQPNQHPVE